MLDSILESIQVVALPTKTDFRSIQVREVALFEGRAGWGEFSPFLEYGAKECVPWLVSGIEAAVVEAPRPLRQKISVNATLPALNSREEIVTALSWYPGCTTVKIKVGSNLSEDLARIAIVRELLPTAKIRVDVNGNWSVDHALAVIKEMYAGGELEYIEQPCGTLEELRELKGRLEVPVLIAGDEVIRKSANPLALDLRGAIDIVMLKVAPLGGIKRSLEIAKMHGMHAIVSSALDSAVGISYGLKLAATVPELNYACGLATGELLKNDVATLPIIDGAIAVKSVVPDSVALNENAISPERLSWWRKRVRDTWNAGAQEWVSKEGWDS
ncbi:MAG TPA: o-succinylbenzoate synthase [Candidatus Nanopelagicaceae bacterium]